MKKLPESLTEDRPVVKYYLNRKKGISKSKAALIAGYSNGSAGSSIEKTKAFQELSHFYKDELLTKISLNQLADEHKKVIVQDDDLGAKNTAIKMALERIEPGVSTPPSDDDKFLVVLRG